MTWSGFTDHYGALVTDTVTVIASEAAGGTVGISLNEGTSVEHFGNRPFESQRCMRGQCWRQTGG